MDFTGGLAAAVAALPAEFQKDFAPFLTQAAALESQTARDVNQITDKVLAELKPMVQSVVDAANALVVTVDGSVTETLALIRRIDGMKVTVTLAPEPGT